MTTVEQLWEKDWHEAPPSGWLYQVWHLPDGSELRVWQDKSNLPRVWFELTTKDGRNLAIDGQVFLAFPSVAGYSLTGEERS